MTSKGIGSHRIGPNRRQKGVSLIPALVTICVFSALTTQVVIPNQQRNLLESNISAAAKTVENIIQASYAYRVASTPSSWPSTIGNNTISGDLVPTYLPFFNNLTPWGGSWTINTSGSFYFETNIGTSGSRSIAIASALAQKIGSYAEVFDDPTTNLVKVRVYPAINGPTTVDDLVITGSLGLTSSATFEINGLNYTAGIQFLPSVPASSERFKQNIQPLDIPTKSVYQLQPVSFDYKKSYQFYKTNNAAKTEIGLIAEQVLPLAPSLTLVKDGKVIGVDYQKLSILLLKTVQELKKEVNALQRHSQQLQKQFNKLDKTSTDEMSLK